MKRSFSGLIVLLVAFNFLLRIPFFHIPLDNDEGHYAFAAFYSMGENFYSSIPTLKLPGIILTYRWLDQLSPGNFALFRLSSAILTSAAVYLMFLIGQNLFNRRTGIFAAITFVIFSTRLSSDSPANTEFFMVPLTLFSIYFFLIHRSKKTNRSLVLSGLSAGLAFLFKQVAVWDFVFLVIWLTYDSRFVKKYFTKLLYLGASFLFPLMVVTVFFVSRGELESFIYHSFTSGKAYVGYAWQSGLWWKNLKIVSRELALQFLLPITIFMVGIVLLLFREKEMRRPLLLWLALGLVGVSFNGWFFAHYFVQVVPVVSLIAGVALYYLYSKPRKILAGSRFVFASSCAVMFYFVLGLIPSLRASLAFIEYLNDKNTNSYLERIDIDSSEAGWLPYYESATYLKEKLDQNDSLFVWGANPLPYYLLRKHPTVSFVKKYQVLDENLSFMTWKGWSFDVKRNQETQISELKKTYPAYILFQVSPRTVFDELISYKEFADFITRNYTLDVQIGNQLVFVRSKEPISSRPETLYFPLEIVKRFAVIEQATSTNDGLRVIFEPMVSHKGEAQTFEVTGLPEAKIEFSKPNVLFAGQDGSDLVGISKTEPSGQQDLHLRIENPQKEISFIQIKAGESFWCNRHYGVNPAVKALEEGNALDLFLEPYGKWDENEIIIYFVFSDGQLGRSIIPKLTLEK